MTGLTNVMRREAERAGARKALVRVGTVASYDPSHYAAKVVIQPEGFETGWLPVLTPWAGNGWGLFAPPTPGDTVDVHFQEGSTEAGFVAQRFYSTVTRPLPAPSGEFWLVHKSGSKIRFLNDGTVEIVSAVQINSTAPVWHHTGNLLVTGDIYDLDTAHGTVHALRTAYDSHRHPGIEPGGGTTSTTDTPV